MTANLSEENWVPIPGYEGSYWINNTGNVCNAEGRILARIPTKWGDQIELRKNGQRERFLVLALMASAGLLDKSTMHLRRMNDEES
jgi:hypothetical protein